MPFAKSASNLPLILCLLPLCLNIGCNELDGDEPSLGEIEAVDSMSNTPRYPSKDIDTRTIRFKEGSQTELEFAGPQIPTLRYSGDGRIGLSVGGSLLHVLKPERLNQHFNASASGASGFLDPDGRSTGSIRATKLMTRYADSSAVEGLTYEGHPLTFQSVKGSALCDETNLLGADVSRANPSRCTQEDDKDCYDMKIVSIVAFTYQDEGVEKEIVTLGSVPLHVEVSDAKTTSARISSMKYENRAGSPGAVQVNKSLIKRGYPDFMELNVVGDGRLMVMRIGYKTLNWIDAAGTSRTTEKANIVYSAYPETENVCNVHKWKDLNPISHAHHDTVNQMKRRYGFAHHGFRDGHGDPIEDGADIYGSYPWMDRKAKNLFFTGIKNSFFGIEDGEVTTRYPDQSANKPTSKQEFTVYQGDGRIMGVSVAGLWTFGKMVLLDGPLNNVDFPIRIFEPKAERKVDIYANYPEGKSAVRMAAGRERGLKTKPDEVTVPLGYQGNGSHIDSIENRFNYNNKVRANSPRDVIWQISNSRTTQEVAFDSWINPNVLIASEMVGSLSLRPFDRTSLTLGAGGRGIRDREDASGPGYIPLHYLSYADGFRFQDFGFTERNEEAVLIQNSAGTLSTTLPVPKFGRPVPRGTPDVRVEPVAMGGVLGKGVWLNGTTGLEYELPADGPRVGGKNWYVGLFLDKRSSHTTKVATLFEIKPASGAGRVRIGLLDKHLLFLLQEQDDNTFAPIRTFNLSAQNYRVPNRAFTHLGFSTKRENNSHTITIYVNGYAIGRWAGLDKSFPINRGGVITVGRPDSSFQHFHHENSRDYRDHDMPGFRGWVDDFRVIARVPTPEEICNEARGTLIQPGPENPFWNEIASRHPRFAHNAVAAKTRLEAGEQAACFVRNNDPNEPERLADMNRLPSGVVSLREDYLFPNEDNLVFNEPRPDSSQTRFCRSCHTDAPGTRGSLQIDALRPSVAETGSLRRMQFDKRQPMQPPRRIWGVMRDSIALPDGSNAVKERTASDRFLIDKLLHP